MQSSLILALRTLVMLLSLAAIPLAAIAGTGSWARVKELFDQARQQAVGYLYSTPLAVSEPKANALVVLSEPSYVAPLEVSPPPVAQPPMPTSPATVRPAPPPTPPFWPRMEPTTPQPVPDVMPAAHGDPLPPPRPAESRSEDPIEQMLHRLKALGAVRYRLETTSPTGETVRFHCKMVSPANPNYVRYFEATSADQLRAVQHVLDQVESWSIGREVLGR